MGRFLGIKRGFGKLNVRLEKDHEVSAGGFKWKPARLTIAGERAPAIIDSFFLFSPKMTNDCANKAIFRHKDAAQIRKVVEAFNEGSLMSAFVPEPHDEQFDVDSWRCANWGTTWDVGADELSGSVIAAEGATEVAVSFYSAWQPPLNFYAAMEAQGFVVEAYYYESGCLFCGIYEEGKDDRFEIEEDSAWARKHLPDILNKEMKIAASLEEMEAEDDDIEAGAESKDKVDN